jgi:zinc transporter 1
VHELHVWRLDQSKAVASAHIVVSDPDVADFMVKAKTIRECLHAYGIHSATLQPELLLPSPSSPSALAGGAAPEAGAAGPSTGAAAAVDDDGSAAPGCQILCAKGICGHLMCCGKPVQV